MGKSIKQMAFVGEGVDETKCTVLVTGAGGFIGSHLAKKLKADGHYVRGVDWKQNEFMENDEFCNEFLLLDLRNIDNCVISLGWAPTTLLKDGLTKTYTWINAAVEAEKAKGVDVEVVYGTSKVVAQNMASDDQQGKNVRDDK